MFFTIFNVVYYDNVCTFFLFLFSSFFSVLFWFLFFQSNTSSLILCCFSIFLLHFCKGFCIILFKINVT